MIHYRSDRSNQAIPHEECSTFRLDGCVKHMLGRNVVHLTKAESAAFCRWIGVEVHRPELETIPGPSDDPLDLDAIEDDLAALVVKPARKAK
jgi:hypothetical protein